MAPPPSASLPLQQRLAQLAQTLQFGWFVGHLTLLACTLRYGLSYLTFHPYARWAVASYRTAFVAAAATYGIVVYKAYRARSRAGKPGLGLAMVTDENVQYLAMALVWLFSRQIPLALLPFAVYSIFHVATYTRTNLLPTLQPTPAEPAAAAASPGAKAGPKPSPPAGFLARFIKEDSMGRFVKEHYDTSMSLVALLELALWFRVFFSALTFSRGSWVLFAVYTVFFRSRYSQSSFVKATFHSVSARVDNLVASQSTPPAARQAWQTVKALVRQATEATDLRKYTSGPPLAAKKAQ